MTKKKNLHTVDYVLPTTDREQMRKNLVSCFLEEVPGTGKGDMASRYQYNVEKYGDYAIYLKRPTSLNKGFDFTVNTSGLYFKKKNRYTTPSHQDVFDALNYCLKEFPQECPKIRKSISDIYQCLDTDLSQINALFCDYEGVEHPIQIILLAVKWLFIEQDCAYWNYSGREMLFKALTEEGLA